MRYFQILNELGIITKQNSTIDVKRDAIKKQAKKFNMNVTIDGIPPLQLPNGKNKTN